MNSAFPLSIPPLFFFWLIAKRISAAAGRGKQTDEIESIKVANSGSSAAQFKQLSKDSQRLREYERERVCVSLALVLTIPGIV